MTRLGKKQRKQESTQNPRFIGTTRGLGCDKNGAVFNAKLAVIARQHPGVVKEAKADD